MSARDVREAAAAISHHIASPAAAPHRRQRHPRRGHAALAWYGFEICVSTASSRSSGPLSPVRGENWRVTVVPFRVGGIAAGAASPSRRGPAGSQSCGRYASSATRRRWRTCTFSAVSSPWSRLRACFAPCWPTLGAGRQQETMHGEPAGGLSSWSPCWRR